MGAFVVEIPPALAKAEHSRDPYPGVQVQKESSLGEKKITLSLSKCFLCSWNSVGLFSAATERQGREQGRPRGTEQPRRDLPVCLLSCA